MGRNKTAYVIVLVIMAVVSLTNLFGLSAAGISVILGIVAFFVFRIIDKQTYQECGLGWKSLGEMVQRPAIWLWIILPSIMNLLVIILAKLILPNYIEHIASRSEEMLAVKNLPVLLIQLLVFAAGEEIAWRAFFQKQLNTILPAIPTIMITSALFTLGHLTSGSLIIVSYDLLFVFVNSLIYGVIFCKTNNVWMSAASHFAANLLAVIILFIL